MIKPRKTVDKNINMQNRHVIKESGNVMIAMVKKIIYRILKYNLVFESLNNLVFASNLINKTRTDI